MFTNKVINYLFGSSTLKLQIETKVSFLCLTQPKSLLASNAIYLIWENIIHLGPMLSVQITTTATTTILSVP